LEYVEEPKRPINTSEIWNAPAKAPNSNENTKQQQNPETTTKTRKQRFFRNLLFNGYHFVTIKCNSQRKYNGRILLS
jgi:predicted GNAT superfamily acetyltransferase